MSKDNDKILGMILDLKGDLIDRLDETVDALMNPIEDTPEDKEDKTSKQARSECCGAVGRWAGYKWSKDSPDPAGPFCEKCNKLCVLVEILDTPEDKPTLCEIAGHHYDGGFSRCLTCGVYMTGKEDKQEEIEQPDDMKFSEGSNYERDLVLLNKVKTLVREVNKLIKKKG